MSTVYHNGQLHLAVDHVGSRKQPNLSAFEAYVIIRSRGGGYARNSRNAMKAAPMRPRRIGEMTYRNKILKYLKFESAVNVKIGIRKYSEYRF